MKKSPSPSRLRLATSPPTGGGEDTPAAMTGTHPLPSRSGGEVARAKPETEKGKRPQKSRSRRESGTTERARALRWVENEAEGLLWQELKSRRLGGYHFTRQHPIGPYFADFCFRKQRLVIEIDGSQHADSQYDRRRDEYMRQRGFSILRFWNHDILKHRRAICETILAALHGRLVEDTFAPDLRFVVAQSGTLSSRTGPTL